MVPVVPWDVTRSPPSPPFFAYTGKNRGKFLLFKMAGHNPTTEHKRVLGFVETTEHKGVLGFVETDGGSNLSPHKRAL